MISSRWGINNEKSLRRPARQIRRLRNVPETISQKHPETGHEIMTEEEKRQQEADSLQISFPGGKLNLTGDTVKMLIPYIGKMLIIAMIAYGATVILGAMRP